MDMAMDATAIIKLATELADANDTDVLLFNGPLLRPHDSEFIELCRKTRRRKNALLLLCTHGGDANAAYRIARYLQEKYKRLTVCIAGECKSAGTLVAVGAHELVMSDTGELGPLDVQLGKKDEIWETDSGLTVLSAIKTLEDKSFDLFETAFLKLKNRSRGRITLKTATHLASQLAIGTIQPIVAQIDPIHVGEVSRAMNIGIEYGNRLSSVSANPMDGTVDKLTNSYPSHGFVIDRKEAKDLFKNVREPTPEEELLLDQLLHAAQEPSNGSPIMMYLSKEAIATPAKEATSESISEPHSEEKPAGEGEGAGRTAEAGGSGNSDIDQPEESRVAHISNKFKGAAQP